MRGADDENYGGASEPGAWLRCRDDSEDGGARGAGGPARRATGRACILNYPQDYQETCTVKIEVWRAHKIECEMLVSIRTPPFVCIAHFGTLPISVI